MVLKFPTHLKKQFLKGLNMKKDTYDIKIKNLDIKIEKNLKSICDQLDWKYSDELKDTIQITINLSILKYMFTMKNTRELLEISMDNMMLEYPDFFTKLKNDENGT